MINYKITPNFLSHEWHITLSFTQTNDSETEISLPNWVPGSYLIRDFARHITHISARCNGKAQPLTQTSKNHWQTPALSGAWEIYYTVYAFDLSVRGSFLSTERGFFDGACLFLKVHGQEQQPHQVEFPTLPHTWQIATTLPQTSAITFQTASYAELIDHPVETGIIEFLEFEAQGIPHRIALSGIYPDFDRARFLADIQKICETELAMFPSPAPFTEYLFLLHLGDNLYGGLEHISSTALLADRHSLPSSDMGEADKAYTELLGLFSHEYFHAWNVKSIKPAVFAPYNLDQENYTEQLWAFEGITSYYDDLFLARSKTISPEAYLTLLAQSITRVQQTQGRLKQTLAQSSFSAWDKFYKQNENSPNAITSYYQQGALAALCLDLYIRQQSRHSLDSIMQALYQDWLTRKQPLHEAEWEALAQTITGLDLRSLFNQLIRSTRPLPLETALAHAGLRLHWLPLPPSHNGGCGPLPAVPPANDFGARFQQNGSDITLSHVLNGGSAEQAGLAPDDRIVAINGYAANNFATQWQQQKTGSQTELHYFRHGVLHHTSTTVQPAEANTAWITIENPAALQAWLQI